MKVSSIIVLGAGSAGLIAALTLKRKIPGMKVQVVRSPDIGIIGAGLVTARHPSIWPDIVVGLVIAALNLDAAKEVWEAAHDEAEDAQV